MRPYSGKHQKNDAKGPWSPVCPRRTAAHSCVPNHVFCRWAGDNK